ncbi:hypothetical protein H4R21_000777 [Coemansia helicoidea]|uniref:Uncharacterized protein n=1 Tax=Coemansia helicoidea TaxID=1286919 RepID=A0ACC1LFE7_9FUNG|nr:hypothetical protein H4R21_000777 [Coemansia helicoidea]
MDAHGEACQEADSSLLALLDCLAEYQGARASSGALLRQGFFDLAVARRSAGYRWISPGRHHGNARCTASVAIDGHSGDIRLVRSGSGHAPDTAARVADDCDQGVRRRRHQHASDNEGSEGAASQLPPEESECAPADPDDPLLWFGVLVPPALRDAQGRFRAALDQLVRLAQLKAQLAQRRQQAQRAIEAARA